MAKVYDLVVNTYEESSSTPVVTHIFHGKTPEQAKAFFKAHLKADSFLRSCQGGSFRNFRCRNEIVGLFEHEEGDGAGYSGERRFC